MVNNCVFCNSKHSSDLSYFGFPKTPERKQEWLEILKLDPGKLQKSSTLCSLHFNPNQIKGCKLIKKAMPEFHHKSNNPKLRLEPKCATSIVKVEEHEFVNVPEIPQNVFIAKIEGKEELKSEAPSNTDAEPEDMFINFTPEAFCAKSSYSNDHYGQPKCTDEDSVRGEISSVSKRENNKVKEVLQFQGRDALGIKAPKYKCCGMIFKKYFQYRTHFVQSRKHVGKKMQEPYVWSEDYMKNPEVKCDMCGKQMRSRTVRIHMLNKHWGERPSYSQL